MKPLWIKYYFELSTINYPSDELGVVAPTRTGFKIIDFGGELKGMRQLGRLRIAKRFRITFSNVYDVAREPIKPLPDRTLVIDSLIIRPKSEKITQDYG